MFYSAALSTFRYKPLISGVVAISASVVWCYKRRVYLNSLEENAINEVMARRMTVIHGASSIIVFNHARKEDPLVAISFVPSPPLISINDREKPLTYVTPYLQRCLRIREEADLASRLEKCAKPLEEASSYWKNIHNIYAKTSGIRSID